MKNTEENEMIPKSILSTKAGFLAYQLSCCLLILIAIPSTSVSAKTKQQSTGGDKKLGAKVYRTKMCSTCHSIDGTRMVGPSFKGIWGTKVELQDGKSVQIDEAYFRESLLEPAKKLVKGYPPTMPTFKGVLTEKEITDVMTYVKSLK